MNTSIALWKRGADNSLEGQIGVTLFDRSGRYPALTPEGAVLLADARNISSRLDFMKARAKGMASGLEPELSVVVDVLFPIAAITEAAKEFRVKFPGTPLQLYVETLGNIQRKQLVKRNYKFPILASRHSIHRRWVGCPRVPRLQFCASR